MYEYILVREDVSNLVKSACPPSTARDIINIRIHAQRKPRGALNSSIDTEPRSQSLGFSKLREFENSGRVRACKELRHGPSFEPRVVASIARQPHSKIELLPCLRRKCGASERPTRQRMMAVEQCSGVNIEPRAMTPGPTSPERRIKRLNVGVGPELIVPGTKCCVSILISHCLPYTLSPGLG